MSIALPEVADVEAPVSNVLWELSVVLILRHRRSEWVAGVRSRWVSNVTAATIGHVIVGVIDNHLASPGWEIPPVLNCNGVVTHAWILWVAYHALIEAVNTC